MQEGRTQAGIDPQAVRSAVAELQAWEPLRRSPRLAAFLEYVVDAQLRGDTASIKAYSIAVDVFGRGEDFDPQLDPIVRVQARRLRQLLSDYNSAGLGLSPVTIMLPVGRYVPQFVLRGQPPPDDSEPDKKAGRQPAAPEKRFPGALRVVASKSNTVWLLGFAALALLLIVFIFLPQLGMRQDPVNQIAQPAVPFVVVEEFENLTDDQRGAPLVGGLAIELVTDLNQFADLSARYGDTQATVREGDRIGNRPVFILSGVVRRTATGIMYSALITQSGSDSVVTSVDLPVALHNGRPSMSIDEVSRAIALRLGSPRGPFHARTREWLAALDDPDIVLETYPCFIAFALFRERRIDLDPAQIEMCASAGAELGNSESQAILALITADRGWRVGSDTEEGRALLEEGARLADEAIQIEPISGFNWAKRGFVALVSGEVLLARQYFSTAMQLNSAAVDVIADYAYVEAQIGNWETANALSALAFSVEETPPNFYYTVPALYALRSGDYRAAVTYGEFMIEGLPDLGAALLVAAGGQLRDSTVINRYLPRLLASQRFRQMGIMPALRYHILDPGLLSALSSGMSHAGVPVDRLARPF